MSETALEYRSAKPRLPHSRAGIASASLGILCLVWLVFLLIPHPHVTAPGAYDPSVAVARLIGLACLACPVVGLVLGIVGLRSRQRRRVTAVVGVCLNGSVILLLAALVALFLAVR